MEAKKAHASIWIRALDLLNAYLASAAPQCQRAAAAYKRFHTATHIAVGVERSTPKGRSLLHLIYDILGGPV